MRLFNVFKSNYCKLVFIIALIGSYFLIPDTVFRGYYYIIAIIFMVTFSLSVMCVIRSVKDKVVLAKTYKSSILSIIATALGLSALQVCGVGAPICGGSIGLGFLSLVFPRFFINFLANYSAVIIFLAIILQLISLYFMGCFSVAKISRLKNKHLDK